MGSMRCVVPGPYACVYVCAVFQAETGITCVADPWGGSYFMEALTAQLEAAAEQLLQEVEGLGGMTEALMAGGEERGDGEGELVVKNQCCRVSCACFPPCFTCPTQ